MVTAGIFTRLPMSWLLTLCKPFPVFNHSDNLCPHISWSFCYVLVFYQSVRTKLKWVVQNWRLDVLLWNILNMDECNFFKFHSVAFTPCLNELCIYEAHKNQVKQGHLVPDPFSPHSKKLKMMYSHLGRPLTFEVTYLHPYHWHIRCFKNIFCSCFPNELWVVTPCLNCI